MNPKSRPVIVAGTLARVSHGGEQKSAGCGAAEEHGGEGLFMQVAFLHGKPVPFFSFHLKRVQGVGGDDAFDGVDQIIGARHIRIVAENHGGGETVHAEGGNAAQFREMGFEIILFLREIADCAADNTHAPAHLMREVAFQERTFLTFLKQHENTSYYSLARKRSMASVMERSSCTLFSFIHCMKSENFCQAELSQSRSSASEVFAGS